MSRCRAGKEAETLTLSLADDTFLIFRQGVIRLVDRLEVQPRLRIARARVTDGPAALVWGFGQYLPEMVPS